MYKRQIEYNAVEVDTLRLRSFTRELISNGRLLAARRSTLSFPVAGTIAEIRAKNGSGVRAGEPIARLDTGEYALQLRKAQLSLEKARMEFYDVLVGLSLIHILFVYCVESERPSSVDLVMLMSMFERKLKRLKFIWAS